MKLTFDFHDEWDGHLPASGVAIVSFLDEDGEEQYGTGHLEKPNIAQVVAMSTWMYEDSKRQLMGDPPYDEED